MKITKYGQSAILIEYKEKRILIDPGSYLFNQVSPEELGKIDIILITHIHSDHLVPEKVQVIVDNNPEIFVLSNLEVDKILEKAEIISPGETRTFDNVFIKCIKQKHGNLPDGREGPDNIGFLIDDKIYHPGDTIYMQDKPKAEILFVPICGTVVMDIKDAVKFSRETEAKIIIPIHYDNDKYPVDVNDFVKEAEGLNVKVLKNGESLVTE